MMTERERYLAVLRHEKPNRIPFQPGHGRQSTRARWHKEGLPADVPDYQAYIRSQLGIPLATAQPIIEVDVNFLMTPKFEEKVIERRPAAPGSTRPGSLIVQDWKGNICEISDEFDVTYLRNAIDFVTRSWLKCPVESRADWADMECRYDANDPQRFPADYPARCQQLLTRDYPSGLIISGPFWQLREWCGFEGLCMLLLDDPDFVREMIRVWQSFVTRMLTKVLAQYTPDYILINEDMAYKEKPMIGPDMCREFLLPCWREWAAVCKTGRVPVYEVDSDGFVGSLIPVWIEAGFICNSPQEVAAGNDLPAYSRQFGRRMAYRGGVDKRAMAKGGTVIRAEIDRLKPAIDAGGFIPSCDHGVPSDVSWPNFMDYCRLLAQATGWIK